MTGIKDKLKDETKTLDFNSLTALNEGEDVSGLDYEKLLEKYAARFSIYQKDFAQYKFRPHAIGLIMGGLPKPLTVRQQETLEAFQAKIDSGKGLTEKQYSDYGSLLSKKNAPIKLSDGAKSYLKKLFKEITFQRTQEIKSKYLDKGIAVEDESIAMLSGLLGVEYTKNAERFENDYFTGEPDIIDYENGIVTDIKSSWDYTTFPMLDEEIENQLYFYQLLAYMDLLKLKKGRLAYVLVDTPLEIILDEKRRVGWQLGLISDGLKYDLPEDLEFEIERNLTYDDIPHEARVKIFDVDHDEKSLAQMKAMIELARVYLVELNKTLESRFVDWTK